MPRLADDAQASWHILADLLGLPRPVATAVWQALFYGPGRGPRLVALFEDFVRSGRKDARMETSARPPWARTS
jgi:hypothetical protein